MNKDNIQFLVTLLLFGYIIFLQQCKSNSPGHEPTILRPDTTIVIDTQFPPNIIVQMPRQELPKPIFIYIDSSRNEIATALVDTTKNQKVKLYTDSLTDENLTIYYNAVVDGELIRNQLDYKLYIPKSITKTIEITKPIPTPASVFLLNLGAGGKFGNYASISVGATFVHKKGWSIGYDYDVLQNAHHVKLGVKLFQLK